MRLSASILIQNYEIWDSFCRVFVVAGAGERILHRHANAEFKKMYVLYEVNNANARALLLDRRSIDISGAREKEGHFHYKTF